VAEAGRSEPVKSEVEAKAVVERKVAPEVEAARLVEGVGAAASNEDEAVAFPDSDSDLAGSEVEAGAGGRRRAHSAETTADWAVRWSPSS